MEIKMKIQSLFVCLLIASASYADVKEKKLANLELNKVNLSVLDTYGSPNEIEIEINDDKLLVYDNNFGKIFTTPKNNEIIKYFYNRKGFKVQVIFNQDSVDSIILSGKKSPFKTRRNIELGSKYSDVLLSYGNPNYIYRLNDIVSLSYNDNIKFQFIKSDKLPLQDWVVSQISIHSN
jgi:hypothetical protein